MNVRNLLINSFPRLAIVCCAIPLLLAAASAASIKVVASTVPANGDVNPYGLVVVPSTMGSLVQGNLLISNFNNGANLQGTGTTIVQISPSGTMSLFAQIDPTKLPGLCPGGVGLTTALVALRSGWVVVGSLPTTDGSAATAQAGCLLVLDSNGNVAETISGAMINGPWDMTALDGGDNASLFVTNVLNGTVAGGGNVVNKGTVLRVNLKISQGAMPSVQSMTIIGSRFSERTDPAALVIGPTGVHLGVNQNSQGDSGLVLYVADSLNNRIAMISSPVSRVTSAGIGATLTMGGAINDPLGLTVAPNGDIETQNGNNGFGVLTTPSGHQILKALLDSSGSPPGAGALFGVTFRMNQFYYVDDATNTLNTLQ